MVGIKSALYKKDVKLTFFFNDRLKCNFFDKILPILTYIGGATFTISFCILFISFGGVVTRHIGIEMLGSLALSHLIVHVLKKNVCRERPKDVLKRINTFNLPIDCYSFPSGHTTSVFAIAMTMTLHNPMLSIIVFPIAFTVAISRIYTGVHYPSDVLAGIVIAAITSFMINIMIHFI